MRTQYNTKIQKLNDVITQWKNQFDGGCDFALMFSRTEKDELVCMTGMPPVCGVSPQGA